MVVDMGGMRNVGPGEGSRRREGVKEKGEWAMGDGIVILICTDF
jgi:hypothetical protein